ncbi:hypothetical protein LSAT2_024758 [Lamellibrachia satsuma]|nr:hypothetical protein LSAT2_024758 [Lamellibrachia satsuma]
MQVGDLVLFGSVIALAVASFGIATHALRYPASDISLSTLIDALYKPYWQIFGEISLDDFEGGETGDCSFNQTVYDNRQDIKRCAKHSWVATLLFAIYMVITNVIFLNLLIALFRERVGCASGSGVGGGAVDDKVGEDDERDARESSPQPGRRLRGGKVTGRRETGRKETGRRETGRKETRRKEMEGKTNGSKERGVGETVAKE